MHAVLCRRAPGASQADFENVRVPPPLVSLPRDLLVRIDAASLNPLDLKRRAARPDPDPDGAILGWSAVGRVEATGTGVRNFSAGDRVWYAGASDRPGCFAELQLVDERLAAIAPSRLPGEDAVALPLAALTAAEALFDHLRIDAASATHLLLINGGGGAVATMAVQLARQNPHVRVVATAGSARSADALRRVGAHSVIDYRRSLAEQVRDLGYGAPTSILSMRTEARVLKDYVTLVAPFGHLCIVDHAAGLDFQSGRHKSLSIHWQAMFTRSSFPDEATGRQGEHLGRVSHLIDAGALVSLPVSQRALDAASIGTALDAASCGVPRPVFVNSLEGERAGVADLA